jgi:hypothetical protein
MIASPCKNCPKENLSKFDCTKNCKLLKAVQNFEIEARKSGISNGQDYFTEIEHDIPQVFKTIADLF